MNKLYGKMLRLRRLSKNDGSLLVEYLNNPAVVRYLSTKIPQPYTLDDAEWWVTTGSKQKAEVKAIEYEGQFCGVVGVYFQDFEYAHSAELGYWVAEKYWGNGIASAAISEFVDELFLTSSLERIYNPVSAPNIASARVMEKTGFSLEGTLKMAVYKNNEFCDELLYARLKP